MIGNDRKAYVMIGNNNIEIETILVSQICISGQCDRNFCVVVGSDK